MMLAPSPVAGAQYNNKEVKNKKKKTNKQSSRSRSKKLDKSSTSESFVKRPAVTSSKSIITDDQLN